MLCASVTVTLCDVFPSLKSVQSLGHERNPLPYWYGMVFNSDADGTQDVKTVRDVIPHKITHVGLGSKLIEQRSL